MKPYRRRYEHSLKGRQARGRVRRKLRAKIRAKRREDKIRALEGQTEFVFGEYSCLELIAGIRPILELKKQGDNNFKILI